MKHDWYQTDSKVVVSALTKNCKKEEVVIDILDEQVRVIRSSGDIVDELDLRLYEPINCQEATYKILSSKIEIILPKHNASRWHSLEKSTDITAKKATKNWDSIGLKEDEEDKGEGDAALNALFQKIYSDADESTKRAMNKSYSESGGTVLSTNWNEIGGKKTEVKAPDGVEYKKWND